MDKSTTPLDPLEQWSPIFFGPGDQFSGRQFSKDVVVCFQDDSSSLHLLCPLFLLLLHQLYLRSSGMNPRGWGSLV